MTTQYAYNTYATPELEYQAEELQKRLKCSMANFAQERFKHSVKMHVSYVQK